MPHCSYGPYSLARQQPLPPPEKPRGSNRSPGADLIHEEAADQDNADEARVEFIAAQMVLMLA